MIQAKIVKGDRVIAHSIANTKPEAEADLLYQLMERINVSISFEYPDSNPTNNPTDRSFVDDYLQLIRKTDEPFEDKAKAFKKKWNKEQS